MDQIIKNSLSIIYQKNFQIDGPKTPVLACEYEGYKFWYSKVYEGDLLHVTRDKYVKNASFVYITE